MNRRARVFVCRHGPVLFAAGVALTTVVFFGILYPMYVIDWEHTPIVLGVINVLTMLVLNFFLADRLLSEMIAERTPSRALPELDLAAGLPAPLKAIAYTPILLKSEAELEFIETCLVPSIEGNRDPHIVWMIVSGSAADMQKLERARMRELQERYGRDRILYFHRDPAMANWERKRGGYMQFMLWARQGCRANGILRKEARYPTVPDGKLYDEMSGDIASLRGAEYFVVGDSDTLWDRDAIQRLVAKMAHRANRKYVIFQTNVQPYNERESVLTAAYGFYKNLFGRRGEGFWVVFRHLTFFGHGAGWRIDRFLDALAGRMREGFLSHDIIEGCFARSALVTDITTYEAWPPNVCLLEKQQYRWWLGTRMARVFFGRKAPDETGRWVRNPLGWTDKYLLARIFSTYTDAPLILLYIATAACLSYNPKPSLFYVAALMYFWFGRNILWDRGWELFRRSLKHLTVVSFLTPVLTLMTALFVMKSLVLDVWQRWILKRPAKHGWVVQGSLSKPDPLAVVYALRHVVVMGVLFGVLGLNHVFAYRALFAALFLVPLALTPLVLWVTALPPDSLSRPKPELQPAAEMQETLPES